MIYYDSMDHRKVNITWLTDKDMRESLKKPFRQVVIPITPPEEPGADDLYVPYATRFRNPYWFGRFHILHDETVTLNRKGIAALWPAGFDPSQPLNVEEPIPKPNLYVNDVLKYVPITVNMPDWVILYGIKKNPNAFFQGSYRRLYYPHGRLIINIMTTADEILYYNINSHLDWEVIK